MSDETLEGWLAKEIKDAENVYGMYHSYRQGESIGGTMALTRLRALKDVNEKIIELWGTADSLTKVLPEAQKTL
jgi:hypothetical protein